MSLNRSRDRAYSWLFLVLLPGILMPVNATGETKALVNSGNDVSGLAWSPDGRHITYSEKLSGDHSVLKRVNVRSGTTETLVNIAGENSQPAYDPNGRTIYFFHREGSDPGEIWVKPFGEVARRVIGPRNFDGWAEDPAPHPSGHPLAFFGRKNQTFGIWLMNEAGDFTPLAHSPNFQLSPEWDHSGRSLYYLARSSDLMLRKRSTLSNDVETLQRSAFLLAPTHHPITNDVFVVSRKQDTLRIDAIDQSGAVRSVPLPTTDNRSPDIAPSGTKLAYVTEEFGAGQIWIADLPTNNGRIPHTIRFRDPRPLENVPFGTKIDGAATGTITVDSKQRRRRPSQVDVEISQNSQTIKLASFNNGRLGQLGTVVASEGLTSGLARLRINVTDDKGTTTRTIPIRLTGGFAKNE